jgi:methylated-DNA-[protein]-cysteine S-methyltransferase
MLYTTMDSPLGSVLVAGRVEDERLALRHISFLAGTPHLSPGEDWQCTRTPFADTVDQLAAYFAGERKEFELHLAPAGTPFQRTVWRELQRIPCGRTIPYGELARRIHRPTASRAVGAANGQNPLPVVIPCHRVIGTNGKLTGYAGGLHLKEALLAHERAMCGEQQLDLDLTAAD